MRPGLYAAPATVSVSDGEGWRFVRLDETADITMGNSPPGDSYNDEGNGIPLINGPVEFSDEDLGLTIKSKYTTSPTKLCKKGDFLVCVRGSTTGRTNIAAFDACIGRGVAAIRAHENQAYLNHFLRTLRRQLFDSGKGSTLPGSCKEGNTKLKSQLQDLSAHAHELRRTSTKRSALGPRRSAKSKRRRRPDCRAADQIGPRSHEGDLARIGSDAVAEEDGVRFSVAIDRDDQLRVAGWVRSGFPEHAEAITDLGHVQVVAVET